VAGEVIGHFSNMLVVPEHILEIAVVTISLLVELLRLFSRLRPDETHPLT
jgi:hypothetical protein